MLKTQYINTAKQQIIRSHEFFLDLYASVGGDCRHSSSSSLLERPGRVSVPPNQWKNRGLNELVVHCIKQGNAEVFLLGKEQIPKGFSERRRLGSWGKSCVPPCTCPFEQAGSYWWGTWSLHLETTCFKGFINLVLSTIKKTGVGGVGRCVCEVEGSDHGDCGGEDKRCLVCGMLCRPLCWRIKLYHVRYQWVLPSPFMQLVLKFIYRCTASKDPPLNR